MLNPGDPPIWRHRATWRGKLVLQVGIVRFVPEYPHGGDFKRVWRDARTEDVTRTSVPQPG